jgi:uroporphyrin-3 C-methyltransferase
MADQNDTPPASSTRKPARRKREAPAAEPGKKRSGRLAAGTALVFATIALIGTSYMGYLINSKRGLTDAKGRLFQVEKDTAGLEELTTAMNEELTTLRETQIGLTDSLKSLHSEIGKGRRSWLIAETENLLIIAQHRLATARDSRLAQEALRAADHQLVLLADPDYLPVRKQIEAELATLAAYEKLNPTGLAQQLGQLASRLDQLPLQPDVRPTVTADPDRGFAREVWDDLKELVRVRTTTDIPRPFLLPEQKYFLRENLRLMLLGAQVALLQGDRLTVEQNARTAQQWLNTYYLASDPGVKAALTELDGVIQAQTTRIPELGLALKALQDLRQKSQ